MDSGSKPGIPRIFSGHVEKRLSVRAICGLLLLGAATGLLILGAYKSWRLKRIATNERRAIQVLELICRSQFNFQTGAFVDLDRDGRGEFGYLQELAGASPVRLPHGQLSEAPPRPCTSYWLGKTARANAGVATDSGYAFLVFLPRQGAPAEPESVLAGTHPFTAQDADEQELRFVCYAWPVDLGVTGERAFAVSDRGCIVLSTDNQGAQGYTGLAMPRYLRPGAAYIAEDQQLADSLQGGWGEYERQSDGFIWRIVPEP